CILANVTRILQPPPAMTGIRSFRAFARTAARSFSPRTLLARRVALCTRTIVLYLYYFWRETAPSCTSMYKLVRFVFRFFFVRLLRCVACATDLPHIAPSISRHRFAMALQNQ